jgi:hypothetical protein
MSSRNPVSWTLQFAILLACAMPCLAATSVSGKVVPAAKGSSGHILKLTPGVVLKGRITPADVDPRIELRDSKGRYGADYDQNTGFYKTQEGLPSGAYHVSATAKGYAPIEKDIQLTASKTTILDLHFVRTGSISGKISPAPSQGAVVAVNIDGRRPMESVEIRAGGSYKIDDLPAGTYDLIIGAKGYERAIGWGPVPGPDTLTDKDKHDIEAIFARFDKAWADKDADLVMALMPGKDKESDAQQRKFLTETFRSMVSYSTKRRIDFIVGQTGKTAVVVERLHRKLASKDGSKVTTSDTLSHARWTLAFESGAWRITDAAGCRPEDCSDGFTEDDDGPRNIRTENTFGFVAPFPGEVADMQDAKPMPWRYSGDYRILSIKVESGGESKGHDFTLTPLAKP